MSWISKEIYNSDKIGYNKINIRIKRPDINVDIQYGYLKGYERI